MLDITFLQNKNILILGAGLSGMSCARFLASHNIHFALNDSRDSAVNEDEFAKDFPLSTLTTGSWDQTLISSAQIILVSPGIDTSIDEISQYLSPNAEMYGDVELYYRLTQTPTIAVTGSNGKSTVVSLVAHIGKSLGFNVELAGNIGVPPLDIIEQELDMLVLELSSFQLETLSSMNAVSASLLNLCDDHLDRHKTLENYQAIKQRIYQQTQCAVINLDDSASHYSDQTKQLGFTANKPKANEFGIFDHQNTPYLMHGDMPLIAIDDLPLSGNHNAINCLAALALGYAANWPLEKMVTALTSFEGLPHRCQRVPSNDGKKWINDSKATNVGATLAAITGLASPNRRLILIAGGQGKGADFSPLTKQLEENVDSAILFGEDQALIKAVCPKTLDVHQVNDLGAATTLANELTTDDDIVLFSPACASFDQFKSYIARGNAFIKHVEEVSQCIA